MAGFPARKMPLTKILPIKQYTFEMNVMNTQRPYILLLLLFFLLAYLLPLGSRHLVVPDETRYAEIPREMLTSGDWIVPHVNGARYFEKPVMGYWIHAASLFLFGENNFAVRFPSALAVGLTAILIYILVYRMQRGGRKEKEPAAALAALIYLSCFLVFGIGNTAVLDNLFSFMVTATIAAFYFATEASPGSRKEKLLLLMAGIICGMAFMTKGFLAFALPILALAPYLIWQRRYLDLFRMTWLPILIAIVVILPWGIAIHLREPDFWHFFIWNEHFRRFLSETADHQQPIWYFFLTAPPVFLPWIFLIPAAFPGIRKFYRNPEATGRLLRLSICWFILPFLFFSVSEGKLMTYILPCFPPFAMVLSVSLLHVFKRERKSTLVQWGVLGNSCVFGIIFLVAVYLLFFGYQGTQPYTKLWKAALALGSLGSMIILFTIAFRCKNNRDKVLLVGVAPLLFFFTAHFIIPDLTNQVKSPGPLLERNRHVISQNDNIITSKNTVKAVCWYLKRDNLHILGWPGELQYGMKYDDARDRLLNFKTAQQLIVNNPGKTVLVVTARELEQWQANIPEPVFKDDNGTQGYVLWRY
jgi:4-amino-4-deoxy-L-arabinose transferase